MMTRVCGWSSHVNRTSSTSDGHDVHRHRAADHAAAPIGEHADFSTRNVSGVLAVGELIRDFAVLAVYDDLAKGRSPRQFFRVLDGKVLVVPGTQPALV